MFVFKLNTSIFIWILSNKWPVRNEKWPWSTFPPYFHGGSTVIIGSAVHPLLEAARIVPFLWIDDAYLIGLLADKAGVSLRGFSK